MLHLDGGAKRVDSLAGEDEDNQETLGAG